MNISSTKKKCIALSGLLFLLGGSLARATESPQTTPSPSAELEKTLTDFRAAANRLERAVSETAKENTADLSRKIDKGVSTVLMEMSQSLNHAAEKLEKRSKALPPKKSANDGS